MKNVIKLRLITEWLVSNCATKRRNRVIEFLGEPSMKGQKLTLSEEFNKKKIKTQVNSSSLIQFLLDCTEHDKVWQYLKEVNTPFGQQIIRQIVLVVTEVRGLQLNGNEILIPMNDRTLIDILDTLNYSVIDAVKLALLPKNSNSPKFRESLSNMMLKVATNSGTEKVSDIFKRCLIGIRNKIKIDSKNTAFVTSKRVKDGYEVSIGTYLGELPIRTYHVHPEIYPMILNLISISNKNVEIDENWIKDFEQEDED